MPDDSYLTPRGAGVSAVTEKRSRFVGNIRPVSDVKAVRAFLAEIRAAHRDARHHVFAYVLSQMGGMRCSDDGEPQGTGGQPVLQVLRQGNIFDACCVVSRYFGGVLLGTGGLARAYSAAAKAALEDAGVTTVSAWAELTLICPFSSWGRVRQEIAAAGGVEGETEYEADVKCALRIPPSRVEGFSRIAADLTSGQAIIRPAKGTQKHPSECKLLNS